VQITQRLREPPHQRMTIRSPDRHLAKPEKQAITRTREGRKADPRRVLIMRRTGESCTVPPSNRRDRRRPKTAIGRFLSKKSQPRLIDLTLNNISAGHSPTPVYLHELETKSLCLHQQRQRKQKKEKNKHNKTASTSATLGGRNSTNPKGLETNIHHLENDPGRTKPWH
jgi:hypothetical protein